MGHRRILTGITTKKFVQNLPATLNMLKRHVSEIWNLPFTMIIDCFYHITEEYKKDAYIYCLWSQTLLIMQHIIVIACEI